MNRRSLLQAAALAPAAALLPKVAPMSELPPMRIIVWKNHLSDESIARIKEFIAHREMEADYNSVLLFDGESTMFPVPNNVRMTYS